MENGSDREKHSSGKVPRELPWKWLYFCCHVKRPSVGCPRRVSRANETCCKYLRSAPLTADVPCNIYGCLDTFARRTCRLHQHESVKSPSLIQFSCESALQILFGVKWVGASFWAIVRVPLPCVKNHNPSVLGRQIYYSAMEAKSFVDKNLYLEWKRQRSCSSCDVL